MNLIEERCYVLHAQYGPKDYLELYLAEGLKIQNEALEGLVGYFATEVGELNAVVSLWRYASFDERLVRRSALAAHPGWKDFLLKVRPMIKSMSNRLLLPAGFSPIQ